MTHFWVLCNLELDIPSPVNHQAKGIRKGLQIKCTSSYILFQIETCKLLFVSVLDILIDILCIL